MQEWTKDLLQVKCDIPENDEVMIAAKFTGKLITVYLHLFLIL